MRHTCQLMADGEWQGNWTSHSTYGRNGFVWIKGASEDALLTSTSSLPITIVVGEDSSIRYIAQERLKHLRLYVRARGSLCVFVSGLDTCHVVLGRASQVCIVDRDVAHTQHVHVTLAQPGGQFSFAGLANAPHALSLQVIHKASHTSSNIRVKGVIENNCGSTKSSVHIHGRKSISHQAITYITQGSHAKAIYVPEFSFHTDEVVATHGATIGQIDEEMLLYFQARGYSRKMATQCYIDGFCQEILSLWPQGVL